MQSSRSRSQSQARVGVREEEKRNLTPLKPVQEEGKESSTVETPIKISMHKITLDARSLVSSLFTKCIGAPNAYANVYLTEEDEVWKVRIGRAPSLLCVTCFNRLSLSRTCALPPSLRPFPFGLETLSFLVSCILRVDWRTKSEREAKGRRVGAPRRRRGAST